MILFINVRITETRLSEYVYERAPWMHRDNRLDIFKYTLASYSAFKPLLSKVIMYIQLDPEYQDRKAELEKYIYGLFPDAVVKWERNFYARDWLRNYELDIADHNDDIIWSCGNEDHPFIDYNLDVLSSGIDLLCKDQNPFSAAMYSHWHEAINIQASKNATLTECGNWVVSVWDESSSIQIIKKSRFYDYFTSQDWGDSPLFRTDNLMELGYKQPAPFYSPTREIVRHYDAYSHVSCPGDRGYPLVIPPGFFENELKIRYGYNDRKEGWVNINPSLPHYNVLESGTDLKVTLDTLPMFWHPVEVDINPEVNHSELNRARNADYFRQSHSPMKTWGVNFDDNPQRTPKHWLSKHMLEE